MQCIKSTATSHESPVQISSIRRSFRSAPVKAPLVAHRDALGRRTVNLNKLRRISCTRANKDDVGLKAEWFLCNCKPGQAHCRGSDFAGQTSWFGTLCAGSPTWSDQPRAQFSVAGCKYKKCAQISRGQRAVALNWQSLTVIFARLDFKP